MRVSKTGSVERNLVKRHFVTVPPGTKALQVNLGGIAANSQVRFIAFNPYGVPVDPTSTTQCYTNFPGSIVQRELACVQQPDPGCLGAHRRVAAHLAVPRQPVPPHGFAQGVTVDPAIQTIAAAIGRCHPGQWTVRNDFGAGDGHTRGRQPRLGT
jgi:hypothetical protein